MRQGQLTSSESFRKSWKQVRTTVNLDEAALQAAKAFAASRSISLGEAMSMLVKRGLTVACPTRTVNGLTVFDLPKDTPAVTLEQVRQLEDRL